MTNSVRTGPRLNDRRDETLRHGALDGLTLNPRGKTLRFDRSQRAGKSTAIRI